MGKLVPQLRFSEFSEIWLSKPFKELTKINQGLQISISERYLKEVEDSYFYITNEFLKKGSKNRYFIKNPSKSVLCTEDDILMTRTGNTGMVVTNVSGAFHNNFFKIAYPDYLNKTFLYYFLTLEVTQNFIKRLAGTSTIPDLNHSDFYRIKMNYPQLPEQQKIASFLTDVDDKITKLNKKKDLLVQYKKGIMQKIFNQELRFKDDDSSSYPKWRKGSIADFGYFYYGKSAPKFSLSEDAPTPCVRYGELYSTYGEVVKEIQSYTNIEPVNLKFSKGGEVLVPRVGEDPLDFANCSYLPIPNVAIGEMISVFNTKENGLFMTYYFNAQLREKFARVVEGANVSNLYFKYLEDIEIEIPSIEEQNKIVGFLSDITNKIDALKIKIEKAQSFKKGLLQKMFV